jgi:hypothetical protein
MAPSVGRVAGQSPSDPSKSNPPSKLNPPPVPVVPLDPDAPALPVDVVVLPVDEAPPCPPEPPLDVPVLLSSPPHASAANIKKEKSGAKCFLMASHKGVTAA